MVWLVGLLLRCVSWLASRRRVLAAVVVAVPVPVVLPVVLVLVPGSVLLSQSESGVRRSAVQ